MRQFTCPKAVTHPSTNRARCRATAMIETNALPLHQTANQCHLYLYKFASAILKVFSGRPVASGEPAAGDGANRPFKHEPSVCRRVAWKHKFVLIPILPGQKKNSSHHCWCSCQATFDERASLISPEYRSWSNVLHTVEISCWTDSFLSPEAHQYSITVMKTVLLSAFLITSQRESRNTCFHPAGLPQHLLYPGASPRGGHIHPTFSRECSWNWCRSAEFFFGSRWSVKKGGGVICPLLSIYIPQKAFCFRELDSLTRGPCTPLGAPPPDPL